MHPRMCTIRRFVPCLQVQGEQEGGAQEDRGGSR